MTGKGAGRGRSRLRLSVSTFSFACVGRFHVKHYLAAESGGAPGRRARPPRPWFLAVAGWSGPDGPKRDDSEAAWISRETCRRQPDFRRHWV